MDMLPGFVPWPEEYVKRYREAGYWEEKTLNEKLEESIAAVPDKEALICEGARVTYRELGAKIDRLAIQFLKVGLKPGDRVVFQLPSIEACVYSLFALTKIGVIPILALAAHRHTEIEHFFKMSDAVGYLIPTEYRRFNYAEMAMDVQKKAPSLKYILATGSNVPEGMISIDELIAQPVDVDNPADYLKKFRPDPYDVALMLLSGGTTALPKLIPRTHNDYVYNALQSAIYAGFTSEDVFLGILPFAHNYTLASFGFLGCWFLKGKGVLSGSIDAKSCFSLIEKEKVTYVASGVPVDVMWLNSEDWKGFDYSSLKVIQNGGARLAPELRKALREKWKVIPQEVYGTAEGLLNYTRLDDPEDMIMTSSGRPVSPADEIKVIDDNGNTVPVGQQGELAVRGPYTIRGYYNAPEYNKSAFTPDGFYKMGDLVRMNEAGFIFTEGRKKDVINRGGEKINVEEVEHLILSHPKVKNVAIVAMPDPVFVERACAWVIPKDGQTVTFKEICDFLQEQNIAKFKWPERMEFVSEFPLSPAGKILKRELKERIIKMLEQEQAAKK
ncbi:2,3-dihydroxybenzoate-AMP ligase [Syntrophus aciditrophicus SB]|uniref:2,3-dihydroxybenzoate-AMP ligase n=2 Tax=Syntrophus TaxID=43773 RepID=Q2LXW4_SYNAS|nr:2,3-dihydroxybenzoate-AMP ligase [Syntrophus aciditrophicus SB]